MSNQQGDTPRRKGSFGTRLVTDGVLLALLWWLLTGTRWDSWIIGVPVVLLGALASRALSTSQPWRLSAWGALRFAPYFLRHSFMGGVDVAARCLHWRLPIEPEFVEYEIQLPPGTSRVFFLNVVSLLPGTLSADLRENTLVIHALDGSQPVREEIARHERMVATLFGCKLAERTAD